MTVFRVPFRLALAGVAIAMTATLAIPAAEVAARPEALRRHAKLLKSGPAANDTLNSSPVTISLWFSERLEVGISRIKLVGARGTTFATGKATHIPGASAATLMAPVTATLPAGTYMVQWIVGTDDGHPMKGSFFFTVLPKS